MHFDQLLSDLEHAMHGVRGHTLMRERLDDLCQGQHVDERTIKDLTPTRQIKDLTPTRQLVGRFLPLGHRT